MESDLINEIVDLFAVNEYLKEKMCIVCIYEIIRIEMLVEIFKKLLIIWSWLKNRAKCVLLEGKVVNKKIVDIILLFQYEKGRSPNG